MSARTDADNVPAGDAAGQPDVPLDLSVNKNRAVRVKREPEAKRAKMSPSSDDLFQAASRPTVVVRSPVATAAAAAAKAAATAAAATAAAAVAADPIDVAKPPVPSLPPSLFVPRPAEAGSAFVAYYPSVYEQIVMANPPPPPPPAVQFRPPQDRLQYLREQQQQQQTYREQREAHTMSLLEQLQHQFTPSAYLPTRRHLPYNTNATMAGPVFAAESSPRQQHHQHQQHQQHQQQHQQHQQPPPSSSSSSSSSESESNESESNSFPYEYSPPFNAAYNFGYHPYFGGVFGADFGTTGMGAAGYDGLSLSGCSGGRSDCLSPESMTTTTTTTGADFRHRYRGVRQQYRGYHDDVHRRAIRIIRSSATVGADDAADAVDPDEIAAIYRQSDFVAFRQRYMDSLGPPRNFEKMRRSMPNKKIGGLGQQYDQTYVVKRQKNNEAAKKSRDAKRQKYIENQISVMYLTKKVSEMKEIKRRLLLSM